jgi:hypothetical protein
MTIAKADMQETVVVYKRRKRRGRQRVFPPMLVVSGPFSAQHLFRSLGAVLRNGCDECGCACGVHDSNGADDLTALFEWVCHVQYLINNDM